MAWQEMGAAVDVGSVGREAWLREEVCKQAAYLSCLLALGRGSVGAGAASRLGKWGGGGAFRRKWERFCTWERGFQSVLDGGRDGKMGWLSVA